MAMFDRPRLERLAEQAENRLGFSIRPTPRLRQLEETEEFASVLANEASEMAWHAMDYFGGRPSELRPERRLRLAQRSRIAFMQDPLAGAEALILANFAFGKGVAPPTARDEKVQQIVDEAWSDPNNVEKLTGFAAQRKLSNELVTSANLFVSLYRAGGRVRVGRRPLGKVVDIVPDPEDELRPLWYLIRDERFEWDYANDRPKATNGAQQSKVRYWAHWRNVEDAQKERDEWPVDGEATFEMPPDDKVADGVIYHVAINQLGDQLFGTPPWARTLRFYSAMNVLTESHVAMAQGKATIIAKRTMKGTPSQITKAAGSVLHQTGELGTARHGTHLPGVGEPQRFAPGGQSPLSPGSWWSENESDKLEPVNLSSGAAEAAQSAQIVRAPVSAASQFGQHYYGDMADASLATAATLELPTLMNVSAWQEVFEQLLRWFTDRAIEAAVRAGRLGGSLPPDASASGGAFRPLAELRLAEAEDKAEMESRTGLDLSYEFQMPYPGKRPISDVSALVTEVLGDFDPNGENIPLRRQMLRFVFTHAMELADPASAVDECIPEDAPPTGPSTAPAAAGGAGGQSSGPDQSVYGEKRQGSASGTATEQEWLPEDLRGDAAAFSAETAQLFADLVGDPARGAALAVSPPAANGSTPTD